VENNLLCQVWRIMPCTTEKAMRSAILVTSWWSSHAVHFCKRKKVLISWPFVWTGLSCRSFEQIGCKKVTSIALTQQVDIIVPILWKLGEPAIEKSKGIYSCSIPLRPTLLNILTFARPTLQNLN
jgi:hypothetical protein